jgi:hypothetical protein
MKKNIFFYSIIASIITLFTITSCEREDPDPGGTAVESMANEWWVALSDDPGNYYHFATYNTTSNSSTEMWLDDYENFWQAKGKVAVDLNSLTFSGANVQNGYYPSTFTVTNGIIIKNGAKGPVSGAVTDSISFDIVFDDDPVVGTVYHFSGYGRTKFSEDDH